MSESEFINYVNKNIHINECSEILFNNSIFDLKETLEKAFIVEMNDCIFKAENKTPVLINFISNIVVEDDTKSLSMFDLIYIGDKTEFVITDNDTYKENLYLVSSCVFNKETKNNNITIKNLSSRNITYSTDMPYYAFVINNFMTNFIRWKIFSSASNNILNLPILDQKPVKVHTYPNLLSTFNESQQHVINNIVHCKSNSIHMFQGGAGQGKTKTTIEAVQQILQKTNERVLYTSTNNLIIEKVFLDIIKNPENRRYNPIVIGNPVRVGEEVVKYTVSYYADIITEIIKKLQFQKSKIQSYKPDDKNNSDVITKLLNDCIKVMPSVIPNSSFYKKVLNQRCPSCKKKEEQCSKCKSHQEELVSIKRYDMLECLEHMVRLTNRSMLDRSKYQKYLGLDFNKSLPSDFTSAVKSITFEADIWKELHERLFCIVDEYSGSRVNLCNAILHSSRLFLSTTTVAGSGQLSNVPISYVFIEEAGQTLLIDSLLTLTPDTKHLILAGDQQQLRGLVMNANAIKAGYNLSMMDYLEQRGFPKMMLNVQYRMAPEISEFPHKEFYTNEILNGENTTKYPSLISLHPLLSRYKVINLVSTTEVFNGSSYRNVEEVQYIQSILNHIQTNNVDFDFRRITIITPYNGQIALLKEKLGHLPIEICTIDSVQGKENDIVIISLVRTENIGFNTDVHRINVLLTRAKMSLLIVGNLSLYSRKDKTWNNLVLNAKLRKSFDTVDSNRDSNLTDDKVNNKESIVAPKKGIFKDTRDKKIIADTEIPNSAKSNFTKAKSKTPVKTEDRSRLRVYNSAMKYYLFDKIKPSTDKLKAVAILDLAVGHGGDLGKYIKKFPNTDLIVGVDINKDAMLESEKRKPTFDPDNKIHYTTSQIDLTNDDDLKKISKLSRRKYDVVNIHFAIHYLFKTREVLSNVIRTISTLMKKNGHLLITCPDGNELRKHSGINNDTWSIKVNDDNSVDYCLKNTLYFSEGTDIVRDAISHEYLVDVELLKTLCSENSIAIREIENTGSIRELKKEYNALNGEEKTVVSSNILIVLQKE